jgi:hypothetical protein
MWWAAGAGFSYQFIVEVMDGFSTAWGFSNTALAANAIGTRTFLAQQLAWKEQRIQLKYSFSTSNLTKMYGPEGDRARNLYGSSIFEQWLKDYNDQTYWASFNLWSLFGKPEHFPKWINLATGYSTNNLLGGHSNTWTTSVETIITSSRVRQRQYLFSLDVDFSRVNLPRSLKWINPISGLIKFPFPALELNSQKGAKGHWIYF